VLHRLRAPVDGVRGAEPLQRVARSDKTGGDVGDAAAVEPTLIADLGVAATLRFDRARKRLQAVIGSEMRCLQDSGVDRE
jgi:hypothetical protein